MKWLVLIVLLLPGCASPSEKVLRKQFADAVHNNDYVQVKEILKDHPRLANQQYGELPGGGGQYPLGLACYNIERKTELESRRKTVQALLDAGADINQIDSLGRNVVWYAVYAGDAKLVSLLLSKGAEPYTGQEDPKPAEWAALYCQRDILKEFARTGDPGMNSVHFWAAVGNASKLKEAISIYPDYINDVDVNEKTPLDYTRLCGYDDCARVLLDAGGVSAKDLGKAGEAPQWPAQRISRSPSRFGKGAFPMSQEFHSCDHV